MRPTSVFVASVLALVPFIAAAQQDSSPGSEAPVAAPPSRGDTQDAPQPTPAPKARLELRPGDPRPEIRVESTGEPITLDEANAIKRQFRDLAGIMYQGLDANPEIMAARAELEAAQARLRQLEMRTATDIVRKQQEIQELETRLEAQRRLVDKEFATPNDLIPLEAELSGKKAEYEYLLGGRFKMLTPETPFAIAGFEETPKPAPIHALHFAGMPEPRPTVAEGAPERLRAMLENPISILFEDAPLKDVVDFITDTYQINMNSDVQIRDVPISINLHDVTIAQALNAIADAHNLAFIIRDYGIFATSPDRAASVAGPSIPESVPYHGSAARKIKVLGDVPLLEKIEFEKRKSESEIDPQNQRFKFDGVALDRIELNRNEVQVVPPGENPTPVPSPESPGNP